MMQNYNNKQFRRENVPTRWKTKRAKTFWERSQVTTMSMLWHIERMVDSQNTEQANDKEWKTKKNETHG